MVIGWEYDSDKWCLESVPFVKALLTQDFYKSAQLILCCLHSLSKWHVLFFLVFFFFCDRTVQALVLRAKEFSSELLQKGHPGKTLPCLKGVTCKHFMFCKKFLADLKAGRKRLVRKCLEGCGRVRQLSCPMHIYNPNAQTVYLSIRSNTNL